MKQRMAWVDGIRFWAMAWIMFGHFLVICTPNVGAEIPGLLGEVLYGVTGKLAVACFCVLLGYFASKPTKKSWVGYSVERYLFFALQVLVVEGAFFTVFYFLKDQTYLKETIATFRIAKFPILFQIVRDSFLMENQIIATYWCVSDFVKGSILVMLLNKMTVRTTLAAQVSICLSLIAMMIWQGEVWIAICVMGWLLRLLEKMHIPLKPLVMVIMIALVPWLIRRDECTETFLLNGVASLFVLYVISQLPRVQRLIGLKPLAFLGRHCFEMFLLHTPVLYLLENLFIYLDWSRTNNLGYAVQFIAAYTITAALAVAWNRVAKYTLLLPGKWIAGKCAEV